jgi:hypothetical protein
MKTTLLALLAVGGLAASANAQLMIVNNVPGTYRELVGDPAATYFDLGDDNSTNISSTVGNAVLPAGTHRLNNNGGIAWNNLGNTGFTNAGLPSAGLAGGNQGLAVYWDDLYTFSGTQGGQGVYVLEDAGVLYVTWNVGHIQEVNSNARIQLQVFSSGPNIAQFFYHSGMDFNNSPAFGNGASATIGYQNGPAGFNTVQYSFNTAGAVTDGTVLTLIPAPSSLALLGLGGLLAARRRR